MIYVVTFILLFAFGFLEFVDMKKTSKLFIFCGLIGFFLFVSAARWETGTDWGPYKMYFDDNTSLADFNNTSLFEAGFRFLNFLVKSFTDTYSIVLLATAIMAIFTKAYTIFRFPYPLISLLGYFAMYEGDWFAVRQSIALGFVVMSIPFMIERRFIPFALLVWIGSLFHGSALVFIISYFVYTIDLRKYALPAVGIALLFLVSGLPNWMFGFAMNKFASLAVDGKVSMQLAVYSQRADEVNQLSIGGLLSKVLLLIYFYYFAWRHPEDKVFNGLVNIYLIGGLIYVLLGSTFMVMIRLSWYFNILEIILIPYTLTFFRRNVDRMAVYVLLTCYFAFRMVNTLSTLSELKLPLYFFWEESGRTSF